MLFPRAAELVRDLLVAWNERTLHKMRRKHRRVDLLILDKLGFVPFKREGGEFLFNLLSDKYKKRSKIVTTNLEFGEWVIVMVFGDDKLSTALLVPTAIKLTN